MLDPEILFFMQTIVYEFRKLGIDYSSLACITVFDAWCRLDNVNEELKFESRHFKAFFALDIFSIFALESFKSNCAKEKKATLRNKGSQNEATELKNIISYLNIWQIRNQIWVRVTILSVVLTETWIIISEAFSLSTCKMYRLATGKDLPDVWECTVWIQQKKLHKEFNFF